MRNFPTQQYTSKSQNDVSSPNKPDWMKRLQEKKNKEEQVAHQTKNIDFDMFPSMNESHSSEITYLEDEDDLAASYFPACDKRGSTMSSIKIDNLPAVSGYNFGELVDEEEKNKKEEAIHKTKKEREEVIHKTKKETKTEEEEEKQEVVRKSKNIDFGLFPSMYESQSTEITYLEDEDDLAASYFPGCDKMGSSMSSIKIDDLPPVSGYKFDEHIQ